MNEPGAKGLRIMTSEEIIKILTQHNAWRRGDGSVMTDVYVLGQAIDGAISALAAPQPQDHSEDNLDMVDRVPDAGETMREAFEEGIRLSDRGHILERSEIYGWYKDIEMVTRWETFQNGWQAAIRESRNTDNQTVKQDFTVESAPTETELSETELGDFDRLHIRTNGMRRYSIWNEIEKSAAWTAWQAASQARSLGVDTAERTGWVPYPIPPGVSLTTRMHLDREQVAALILHLQRWLDNDSFAEPNA